MLLFRILALAVSGSLCYSPTSVAQRGPNFPDPAIWKEVESEMHEEINLLRRDPADYATKFIEPLKASLRRIPKDPEKEYKASRILLSDDPIDYIEISEGDSQEDALAVIDEAIDALQQSPKLIELKRIEPLDAAARWYSDDFMRSTKELEPHTDSLGRKPGARISAFGATEIALRRWKRFRTNALEQGEATLHLFKEEDEYFLVDLPTRGGYRYRSVSEAFGKFVEDRGESVTIPRIDKEGIKLNVVVDPDSRLLRIGEDTIDYPLEVPGYGENIVWGPWSRKLAARGLVCWWILDPGVPDRGHRGLLLEPELRFCGVGCTWSRRKGFVATLDATTDPLVRLAD